MRICRGRGRIEFLRYDTSGIKFISQPMICFRLVGLYLQLMVEEAKNIIKPQYMKDFEEFYYESNARQRRGFELIQQICKNKGRVKLFQRDEKEQTRGSSMSKMDILNRTAQSYRTNQLTTSYQTTFGLSTKKDVAQTIFRFKNVSETDYAKVLTEPAQLFIDSWIELGDRPLFQEDVLVFLRGMYAKIANKLPSTSQTKQKYIKRTDWSLSQPLRFDKIGADIRVWKPDLKAIQKQKAKEEKSQFAQQLKTFKQFKIN